MQETLLVVFIAMNALAWVAIAATVAAVGWQIFKLLEEARIIMRRVDGASAAAIADLEEFRARVRAEGSKLWTIVDFALGMAARTVRGMGAARRPKKKQKEEEAPAEDLHT